MVDAHTLAASPLLSLLLATPLCAAALCAAALRHEKLARRLALAGAGLTLVLSLLVVRAFDAGQEGFQLVERAAWIPRLGVSYQVGIDGLSLFFLPATALLFAAALLTSRSLRSPLFFALMLLLEAATLGVFCALDTLFFFFCWELALLPVFFLISLWGEAGWRQAAAVRYFFIMLAGGVPLLFGLLLLAFGQAVDGVPLFDLPALLAAIPLSGGEQKAVFLLLLLGFAAKVPLLPLHTWLPALALGAPAALTAPIVGLKLGAYGLIRFAVPLAPAAAQELHWLLAGLGTVALLYGAVAALAQSNLRAILAYLGLSHVGLVVLGLASFSVAALQGAILQLLNFMLAAGGGFLLLGFLQRRTGSTDVTQLSGVAQRMPWLAGFFLLFGLAGMGLPGTSGFPGDLLLIVAIVQTHGGAGLAALFGMVVGAAAFLAPYRRAFFGRLPQPALATASDLTRREFAMALVFAALVLLFGFFPALLLEQIAPATEAWVSGLNPRDSP